MTHALHAQRHSHYWYGALPLDLVRRFVRSLILVQVLCLSDLPNSISRQASEIKGFCLSNAEGLRVDFVYSATR
jgi:hypothetical protein